MELDARKFPWFDVPMFLVDQRFGHLHFLAHMFLQSRRGDWGRDLACYLGQGECGLALREIGEFSGGVDHGPGQQSNRQWLAKFGSRIRSG